MLQFHFNESATFSGTSSTTKNDLITSIVTVIKNEIREEIAKSKFISIMGDRTPDLDINHQPTIIFRYSYSNKVYERFMGFINVETDDSSEAVAAQIQL